MVHRNKDFNSPPAALVDAKWNTLKADLLIERSTHSVNSKCYRDCTIDELALLYKNKCAICERDRGTELQVDHYRPKKPRNNITQIQYNHPGYYWLAYNWSNLIPLCSICNIKKSNKFPLSGWTEVNRISDYTNVNGLNPFQPYDLDWLQTQEQPLMINPEHDKTPERHFSFHRNGRIVGRTDEGIETINICRLNRKDLIRERLKIREGFVNAIKSALDDFTNHNNQNELKGELVATFKQIKLNGHKDNGHSYYNLFIYNYYDYFIDAKLPANLRGVSTKYFRQWVSTN
jgi:hypothetical protein